MAYYNGRVYFFQEGCMPAVKKGESRNEYVSRAIPELKKEHPEKSQKAVVGMAEGMFSSGYKGHKGKNSGKR